MRTTKKYTPPWGRALTSFGRVEHALCMVFCNCVNWEQSNPSESAFWAILSFEAKLNATDAVFSSRFPETHQHHAEHRSQWITLKNTLIRRNRIRNKIAHGVAVTMFFFEGEDRKSQTLFAPYFYSSRNKLLRTMPPWDVDQRPSDRMSALDIRNHAATFTRTARSLYKLATVTRDEVRKIEVGGPEA
jgi:hypothetical protein